MCEHFFTRTLLLWSLSLVTLVWGSNVTIQQGALENCVNIGRNITMVTFPGWPFQLDCKEIFEDLFMNESNECYISSNDHSPKHSNETFRLNSSTTFNVSLVRKGGCWSKIVTIELRSISTRSTFDSINYDVKNNISVVYARVTEGSSVIFDCLPPSSTIDGRFYKLALPPSFNATWWRTRRFENGTLSDQKTGWRFQTTTNFTRCIERGKYGCEGRVISNPPSPHSLKRRRFKYFDPAVYSCELQYKNETAFITHQSKCWQKKIRDSIPPLVMCTNQSTYEEGENVTINCSVHSSNIMIISGELKVLWTKEGSSKPDCTYVYKPPEENAPKDSRLSCSVDEFLNLPPKCFSYMPSNKDLVSYPDKSYFKITFKISNAKKSDSGMYHVQVIYRDKKSKTATIRLELSGYGELWLNVIVLGAILALLLLIIFAASYIWWNWIRIVIFLRQILPHIGKCDQDSKEFVAMLSYVFSEDLPQLTRERTKRIVHCIQEKMEAMEYKFYDSHKSFEQGSSIENLLKYLNESHCMIVILTDAYVDGRWSRFEAKQGFLNLLKNRTKLIFIRTPGAMKTLNKCIRNGDDFSSELKSAMKASRIIRWNEKMNDSSFKDHLQYALPNLKRLE